MARGLHRKSRPEPRSERDEGRDERLSRLCRLYRNHHYCTTIAVQAVQEWCDSGKRRRRASYLGGGSDGYVE